MKENSVTDTQMDAHLARVQREAKWTLDRFGKSGINITKPFVDYFFKVTYERLQQTCERYCREVRWKIPRLTPEPKENCDQNVSSDVDQSKNAMTSNLVKVQNPKSSDEKPERKRRSKSPVTKEKSKRANTSSNKDGTEKYTVYSCVHCRNSQNSGGNSFSGTIDDVYGHWLAKHVNESISHPFRFNAISLVGCFHCEDIGTYHELVEHHKVKHPGEQFAIVNRRDRKKCGVCHFKDGDLIEHSKEKHDPNDAQLTMIFNPIRYSETRITELMKINVHKKRQCNECNGIFDTQDEIVKHFATSHTGQTVQSKEFVDKRCTLDYFICGSCFKNIGSTQLLSHFQDHSYNFTCTQCPKQSVDIAEMICHEKIAHNIDSSEKRCNAFQDYVKPRFLNTDIVFNNGLILKICNVLETKFDDSKLFAMSIDRFLDLMKDQAKKMIELNVSQTQNHPISQISMNPISQISTIPISSNVRAVTPQSQTQPETRLTEAISLPTTIIEPDDQQQATVTPTTSQLDLSHIQSPPLQIDSAAAIRRLKYITKLIEQQELANNVYIDGLSTDLHTKNPLVVFLKYCRQLGIVMPRKNIEDVVQRRNGIIVKFHQLHTKESFMSQISGIRSCGQFPQEMRTISVQHHMTQYYYQISQEARKLKRRHLLHSYNLYKDGFLIKITANGAEHTIQSKQQLIDLIRS